MDSAWNILVFTIQIDFPIHGTNHSHIYYWGIFAARDQKGTMKHFVPPGTKGQETCDPSGVRKQKKPIPEAHHAPGGTNFPKIPHLTPSGSHVYSILGRKAHNGTMKTFVPQGAQCYNKNILCRQGPKGIK